jgi:hypothetical protein
MSIGIRGLRTGEKTPADEGTEVNHAIKHGVAPGGRYVLRKIDEILDELQGRKDCVFLPSAGLPTLSEGLRLPDDLRRFYERFSEARLFGDRSDPRYHIPPPGEFVQIGFAIYSQPTSNAVQRSWYALAHVRDGNYIAIDCAPSRLGYCYDAFHETIDDLSYCGVIARSFTELMNRAAAGGDEAWWLRDKGYGYADRLGEEGE